MNGYEILGIVLLAVLLTLAVVYFLVPYLQIKNIPVENILEQVDNGIDTVDTALTTINKIAPIPYFTIVDKIFDYARIATTNAERLYKIGTLEKDARKENAKQYVKDVLNTANIEVTEDINKVIDGAVEASVELLPKTHQE